MVVPEQMRRDLAGQTRRRNDDSLTVLGEELSIDARLGVETLRVRQRRELNEIAIPDEVPGKQDQVIVRLLRGAICSSAGTPIRGRNVGLHPDDRLELFLPRLFLEIPGCVQITMIGNRQGGLLELLGSSDQVFDPVRAVEERVF